MVVLGTEIKINVHIDPIGDVHMSQYDFECDFYANSNKRITINKSNMIKVDEDNYIALIKREDAIKLGRGKITIETTAYIPDEHFPDGTRLIKDITYVQGT